MKTLSFRSVLTVAIFLLFTSSSIAVTVDLSSAGICASPTIKAPVRETILRMLKEELASRTMIDLKISDGKGKKQLILLALDSDTLVSGLRVPQAGRNTAVILKAEGFRVLTETGNGERLWLIGKDERGVLFAAGYFLRNAVLGKKSILFNTGDDISTSPVYPIRGHQLGYRNTANSWDAWSPEQFEQYIRELAVFGTNCIENIPFQDGPLGPNMKYPREFINLKLSQICRDYGLDYWVWTPADADLSDSVLFRKEVLKHAEFYKNCPELDGVFFPGGDPGNNHPRYVLPFLKAISAELRKYHPGAGVWISLQGFSEEEVDYFYSYLEHYKPEWLEGVVSGPSSPDLAATRFRLPVQYKHRHYPDITHTVRCQYPTENWDQAFALTEGREVCNPQPFYYASIHNRYAPFTDGFLSYSDGVHDDVNKVVWSQLGWDPGKDVTRILAEYSRFFFGSSVATKAADGILGLENNWKGPVENNGGIEAVYAFWKDLDEKHPELRQNWRWQLLQMRSCYDTYVMRRKIYEQELEKESNKILLQARATGSELAMDKVLSIVNRADSERAAPDLRLKISDYCEALYRSVGLQTSVSRYKASGEERGAILDFIDYPLNNRWWLADEFDKIRLMTSESEKLERLHTLATWDEPGPGSYYDNISDISKSPRVTTRTEDNTDYAWWDNGMSRRRLSTQLFQNCPRLVYHDLDPGGRYIIRVAGYGDALVRVDGERLEPMVYNKGYEEFKEFLVPRRMTGDGALEVTFDQPEESALNWRQQSKVSDVWLLKTTETAPIAAQAAGNGIESGIYLQDNMSSVKLPGEAAKKVLSLFKTGLGTVAVTGNGIYRYSDNKWSCIYTAGNISAACTDNKDRIWIADDNLIICSGGNEKISLPVQAKDDTITCLCLTGEGKIVAGTSNGMFIYEREWSEVNQARGFRINDIITGSNGDIWAATNNGLLKCAGGQWTNLDDNIMAYGLTRRYFSLARTAGDQGILFGGLFALGCIADDAENWLLRGADGLPCGPVTKIRPYGKAIWIGTKTGAIMKDSSWHYYAGKRWLPDDHVNDILPLDDNTTWIATDGGISSIEKTPMRLSDKAELFEKRIRERHDRYGLVSDSRLLVQGDLATNVKVTNDNDGLWTSIYLAAECFRYAVTKDPEAKENAIRAFEAMEKLETITGIPGFPARSFVKADEDTGHGGEWHLTKDGKWKWKGDTSSDEIVGHMFAYPLFYDLVATGDYKTRARDLVYRIMDNITSHNFVLPDLDGKPTRWGVWNPDSLNGSQNWLYEKGINSLQILSFLQAAAHVTGDMKFMKAYDKLIREDHYDQNMVVQKMYGPFDINHSDDELSFLPYYILFRYSKEPDHLSLYRESMERSWAVEKGDRIPIWNIIASISLGRDCDLQTAVEELEFIPLDLITWTMANSHRWDLPEDQLTDRFGKRQAVRPVPTPERGVSKWNSNTFLYDSGNNGMGEDDGSYYLLPYWMGRYHGLILQN